MEYKALYAKCHVQDLCDEKGISMRKLAHEAGISETQMYKASTGECNWRLDTIIRIMTTLNCSFDDIFTIVKY